MEVKIRYSKKEIEALCLENAKLLFGEPPQLKEWCAIQSYNEVTVELIDAELRPEPPPSVAPLNQAVRDNEF